MVCHGRIPTAAVWNNPTHRLPGKKKQKRQTGDSGLQHRKSDWRQMEERIATSNPDVVACASLATCNTYAVTKTLQTAT